jgi:L-aspartate oxidase
VYLDARDALGDRFAQAFPGVAAACRAAGLDPARQPLPVRPATHYHCGGVSVDRAGRTGTPGLWAVGEVASTGLHGANRLASNSLLEALVCSQWVAADVAGAARTAAGSRLVPPPGPVAPPGPDRLNALRDLVSQRLGVLRRQDELLGALSHLRDLVEEDGGVDQTDDATLVAALVCHAALDRRESRGAHSRVDRPGTDRVPRHTLTTVSALLGSAGPSDAAGAVLVGAAR